jgi:hypothetical protein
MALDAHENDRLEPPGVQLRPVLLGALGALALMLAAIFGMAGFYAWQVGSRVAPLPEQFPQPRVQTGQAEERKRLQAEQRRRLAGYGWADESRTLVRIPIERAMEIIAQRRADAYAPLLPASPALAAPSAGAQRALTAGQGAAPAADEPSDTPRQDGQAGRNTSAPEAPAGNPATDQPQPPARKDKP